MDSEPQTVEEAFDAWLRSEMSESACPHCGQFRSSISFKAGAAWARTPTLPAGADSNLDRLLADLHADPNLSSESMEAVEAMLRATYDALAAGDRPPAEREETQP